MAAPGLNMPPTEILHESFYVRLAILHTFISTNFSLRWIITKMDPKKKQFWSLVVSVGQYKILNRIKKGFAPK